MTETTTNKVVRLEVQMSNVVAEIAEVKALVKEVIVKVDRYGTLESEIMALKVEIKALHQKTFRNGWVFPTLAAVAGSVLTFLIISFFTSNK